MNIVIGAGIAGLGAAYSLENLKEPYMVLEKNNTYGGLLDNFEIKGFLFDNFIHLSFGEDPIINSILYSQIDLIEHIADPWNLYEKHWVKHPVITNLGNLNQEIQSSVLNSFDSRRFVEKPLNYKEWSRSTYGDYYSKNFVEKYTKKYWTVNAESLSVNWIGKRMNSPSRQEIINGIENKKQSDQYYLNKVRYPRKGGFKALLQNLPKSKIHYNKRVVEIDPLKKHLTCEDGTRYYYNKIFSSLPLPEYTKLLIGHNLSDSFKNLNFTSGYLISIGINGDAFNNKMWYYLYDDSFLSSRVYSPSLKSSNNAPIGCSSLQAEIYTNKGTQNVKREDLEKEIDKISDIHRFKSADILVKDFRFQKYANVIFDHKNEKSKGIIKNYLEKQMIYPIGRYGTWDYLWSHQSLANGISTVEKVFNSEF